MTDALTKHLIEVIDWHRTWIKAVDFGSYRRSVAVTDASVIRVPSRVFRLEVRIALYGYRRGMIISVPEERIDKAISACSALDRSLISRLNTLSLTFSDVNMIFSKASWGTLDLGLVE